MDYVPYKLLNGTECSALAAKAASAAAGWSAGWSGRAVDADEVSALPAADYAGRNADDADWLAYETGGGFVYFAGRQHSGEWAARMLSAATAAGESKRGSSRTRATSSAIGAGPSSLALSRCPAVETVAERTSVARATRMSGSG